MAADERDEYRMEKAKYNCSDVSTFPFHLPHHAKRYLTVDWSSRHIFSVVIVGTLIVSEAKSSDPQKLIYCRASLDKFLNSLMT